MRNEEALAVAMPERNHAAHVIRESTERLRELASTAPEIAADLVLFRHSCLAGRPVAFKLTSLRGSRVSRLETGIRRPVIAEYILPKPSGWGPHFLQ